MTRRRPAPDDVTKAGGRVITQLDFISNVQFGGWWLAQEMGFFYEEKLGANFLNGETANVSAVVAGGSADIGISGDIGSVTDVARPWCPGSPGQTPRAEIGPEMIYHDSSVDRG